MLKAVLHAGQLEPDGPPERVRIRNITVVPGAGRAGDRPTPR